MLRWRLFVLLLVVGLIPLLVGWQGTDPGKLDDAGLKSMLSGLGYEVKEPGTTTYEVKMSTAGLDIPTRLFLSKSKTKLWLSVALLTSDKVEKLTREDLLKILQSNVDVGPCHFMIENGWLKLKMALDNRAMTPAVLRTELDYLAARVADSKAVWQK